MENETYYKNIIADLKDNNEILQIKLMNSETHSQFLEKSLNSWKSMFSELNEAYLEVCNQLKSTN